MEGMRAADAEDGEPSDGDGSVSRAESGTAAGEMTPEEATRTIDSVEEGQPQVVARPGAAGDRDW
jgi:hypothetical protein